MRGILATIEPVGPGRPTDTTAKDSDVPALDDEEASMPEQPRPPERTSGTDDREPRTLMSPVEVYDLEHELERLRAEPAWSDGHQNAVTLAKGSNFRIVLLAMKPGARVGEDEAHGRMSVQVLRGAVTVRRPEKGSELAAGQLAAMDAGAPWAIEARDESAVLLTIAWPEERSLL